jgi:exodeoxyribonuclease VII small subunit
VTEQTPESRWTDRPTYEQARDELVTIVARLESGESTLEESLELWERGEYLAAIAQEHLDGAQARLDAARGSTTNGDDATTGRQEG